MSREISRWGVGPSIGIAVVAYAALAGFVSWTWPQVCSIPATPYSILLTCGLVLVGIGVPMLVVAGRAATVAYNSDKLATNGIFGLVRHPIYSAWIVFIIPSLVLLSRSWPLLLTPLVAYIVFKIMIRREDDYLEQRFGDEYRQYRIAVNELLPWPKRR
jgi:protein-S-isoprenylcysteine O-methyltransferase Ste14